MLGAGEAVVVHPRREERGEERRDVKLGELFLPCRLGRGLDVRRTVFVFLTGRVFWNGLH